MAVPTDYILTVHTSEYDAINDLNPIPVRGGSTSGLKNLLDVDSAGTQGFYTHVKYFYRVNSAVPCTKFYIDWDFNSSSESGLRQGLKIQMRMKILQLI